jgi:hypothetical protein
LGIGGMVNEKKKKKSCCPIENNLTSCLRPVRIVHSHKKIKAEIGEKEKSPNWQNKTVNIFLRPVNAKISNAIMKPIQ